MKRVRSFVIPTAIFLTIAAFARAEDRDVPVNDEPAGSDAIVISSPSADRSPAGWFSEPNTIDGRGVDADVSGVP